MTLFLDGPRIWSLGNGCKRRYCVTYSQDLGENAVGKKKEDPPKWERSSILFFEK